MDTTVMATFLEKTKDFQGESLPELAYLAGYSALIKYYNLKVPLPEKLSAIGMHHKVYETSKWRLYTPRHQPNPTVIGHLIFALKYEGLDLLILKRLFEISKGEEIVSFLKTNPTSSYGRRLWFLYEWLLNERLDLQDAKLGSYVEVVNDKQQYCIKGQGSLRHRVYNNLPGTKDFCPLIFKTQKNENYIAKNLQQEAETIISNVSPDILMRTAFFLLLKDSKSSYAIEGESPPEDRIQRWGRVIKEAGQNDLSLEELQRLQKIIIGESRFINLGLRTSGGFVGVHEPETQVPIPDHISAKYQDLPSLIEGLIAFDQSVAPHLNPVLSAAILSFGFIYIHPFEDGNGRLHRYLMHHSLARLSSFGSIFPISVAILERINDYRSVLENYSKKILPLVDWIPTNKMNVEVLNETADFYRYFDATKFAEFLFECVEKTILNDMPNEIAFLKRYDLFKTGVGSFLEMPFSLVDLLFKFLHQTNGKLSKRALEKEFSKLTSEEVKKIEKIYYDSMKV